MSLKFPRKSKNLDALTEKLSTFLSTVIDMSNSHKPPGRNASNGWFRALMVAPPTNPLLDTTIPYTRQIILLNNTEFDPETEKLYNILRKFIDDFIGGFQSYNNAGGNDICWDLLLEGALSLTDEFVRFIFDDPQASDNLKAEVKKLYASYTQECVSSGEHMNGHIATTSRNSANNALALLSSKNFSEITTKKGLPINSEITETQMVADLLRITFKEIATLSTENHKPWLRGEWQLSITVIFQSCLTALTSLEKLFKLNKS